MLSGPLHKSLNDGCKIANILVRRCYEHSSFQMVVADVKSATPEYFLPLFAFKTRFTFIRLDFGIGKLDLLFLFSPPN